MHQDLIKDILSRSGIHINTRRPLDDHDADGYLESDKDFILNNRDAIVALLDEGGLERFAKLVLQECYEWTRENGGLGSEIDYNDLKQHFGVKT